MGPARRRALAGVAVLAAVALTFSSERAWAAAGPGAAVAAPAEIAAGAVPLLGTEPAPAPAPPADLVALAGWLGEARVVGLGEGEHGTHTLHRLTHRVFAHLADHAGFDVLALEIDGAHAALLDAWVQGQRNDLEAILAERWWGSEIFYDEAMLDLLRWMRQRNRAAAGGRRLRVAGFDLKQPALAARTVVEALRPIDATAADAIDAHFRRALAPGAFGLFPNVWGFTGTVAVPLPRRGSPAIARVELEARGEGVTYGTAGVSAEAGAARQSAWLGPGELGGDWRPLELGIEVPPDAAELVLTLHHRGDGTVWLASPRVAFDGAPHRLVDLAELRRLPLMMPRLQADDYTHASTPRGRGGAVLRIASDPLLPESRAAAAAAEAAVRAAVERAGDRLDERRRAWLVHLARLVRQAVEWRTLGETNRDVFLAENLLWLAETAFPSSRLLALAHRSHTERRPGRMGAYLEGPLGASYRTVSMLAGSGEELAFGDLATLEAGAALEPLKIEPAGAGTFEAAIGALRDGDVLLPLAQLAGSATVGSWLAAVHSRPSEAPDVVIRVDRVAPMRPLVAPR